MWTLLLILIPVVAVFYYLFQQKKLAQKQAAEKIQQEKEKPKPNPKEKPEKKEKSKPKPKKPMKETEQKLVSAEKAVLIGKTLPLSISFANDNSCFLVNCQGHQQVLFPRSAIDTEGIAAQRYNLLQEDVTDCTLVTKPSLQVLLCVDRIRDPGVQAFHVGLDQTRATPSSDFSIEKAHNFTLNKVRASDDGAFIATLGDETHFNITLPKGERLLSNDARCVESYELAVSHDFVTVTGYTNGLVVYGIKRNEFNEAPLKAQRAFSVGHKNSINTVDFRSGTMEMVTGSQDCSFIVWLTPERWIDGDIARKQWEFDVGEKIQMVRAAPKSDFVAVLTNSQRLLFYNKKGLQKTVEKPHSSKITHMEWTADGKWLTVLSTASSYLYAYACPQ